ncbi:hypothetical protein D7D52_14725 [Nocardia yunnanensis]|uniref:Uncharacterized protein n=1 Tax=Nocardia yunnanensis TaxID=2382165 RepID=A0A386ZC73_9NOCA|nr:hypothetical protein [Nocardia yunnanensis]AYF74907.1 hypothetical protein D7D52_14725 [Nocardia yunnanensis]
MTVTLETRSPRPFGSVQVSGNADRTPSHRDRLVRAQVRLAALAGTCAISAAALLALAPLPL